MKNLQSQLQENDKEFEEKFPNKMQEVIDDFGSP